MVGYCKFPSFDCGCRFRIVLAIIYSKFDVHMSSIMFSCKFYDFKC